MGTTDEQETRDAIALVLQDELISLWPFGLHELDQVAAILSPVVWKIVADKTCELCFPGDPCKSHSDR
jgi:hypothetical protein